MPNNPINLQPGSEATFVNSDVLKMPSYFLYLVIFICAAPFTLSLVGVNFASSGTPFDLNQAADWPKHQQLDAFFYRLSGAFTHTLLEWTAFCAAIFTVALAFSHYVMSKDYTTPVIGAALFLAGCMDAFHTLAANRLIEAVADNRNLIPFTWAICRIFNALILIGGVSLLLFRKQKSSEANLKFLCFVFLVSAVVAYSIIHYCAVSAVLPQTQYPDSLITRPYDVIPLVLFALAGMFLFPYFYRQQPSVFAHALVIAMIPEVVVELHMAFGSSALFDHNFNIAHFLKIFAYVVPFCGLLVDYIHTYQAKEREAEERKKAEIALKIYTKELKRSNDDLDKFAHIASHDLKAPLRGIDHLATWIEEDREDQEALQEHIPMMHQRIGRMERLLDDLLTYSSIGKAKESSAEIDVLSRVREIYELSAPPVTFTLKLEGEAPLFTTEVAPFETVIRNLIGNTIKHHDRKDGIITVSVKALNDVIEIIVADDGPGIAPEYHNKIFEVFQTLEPRDKVEGSGIGLALVKKTLESQGGSISVQSDLGRGTKMIVRWKTDNPLPDELAT
ncbi:MAG: hypothetical protein COA42_12825 [Alteromonadaceae bacterium]|nr:MAG: hypothetical protein COA42_12825 [Alteromonadaceae bacterium]